MHEVPKIALADSLDREKELYTLSGNSRLKSDREHTLMMKDLYRQQLDQVLRQKREQQNIEKTQQIDQQRKYNERLQSGLEAQRMKEYSYKNYYQMIMKNQTNASKNYVSPFHERDSLKDRLIMSGLEEDRKRSELWQQQQKQRLIQQKRDYQEGLAYQVYEKEMKNAHKFEEKIKGDEFARKIALSPMQLDRYERDRKFAEMQKYKQDLDKTKNRAQSVSGSQQPNQANDFNLHRIEGRHDLLVNPMPYNIQNPYILREMQRRL